ncbi:D-alanine aminotransferase [bacterium HR39]|nr:D-alanine aminotransferase [bacterium HR39]
MGRVAWVDGRFVRLGEPAVGLEDRGYQFGDGVYEMVKVVEGIARDLDRHLARLERSLAEIRLAPPPRRDLLRAVAAELLRRNPLRLATLYIQVTRGEAPRAHPFPKGVHPRTVMVVRRLVPPSERDRAEGVAVLTAPEIRWARRDIKTVNLLANVLARQRAAEAGCREAVFVEADGTVTEASAANLFIVDEAGVLRTHPADERILPGITRAVVLELARAHGLPVEERAFTLEELLRAREAFLTGTTSFVLPVATVDGRVIGNGRPGEVTRTLGRAYCEHSGIPELARVWA